MLALALTGCAYPTMPPVLCSRGHPVTGAKAVAFVSCTMAQWMRLAAAERRSYLTFLAQKCADDARARQFTDSLKAGAKPVWQSMMRDGTRGAPGVIERARASLQSMQQAVAQAVQDVAVSPPVSMRWTGAQLQHDALLQHLCRGAYKPTAAKSEVVGSWQEKAFALLAGLVMERALRAGPGSQAQPVAFRQILQPHLEDYLAPATTVWRPDPHANLLVFVLQSVVASGQHGFAALECCCIKCTDILPLIRSTLRVSGRHVMPHAPICHYANG